MTKVFSIEIGERITEVDPIPNMLFDRCVVPDIRFLKLKIDRFPV